MRSFVAGLSTVLALSAVGALAGCGTDRSAAGALVDASKATSGPTLSLEVPLATFDVAVGTPVSHLSGSDVDDGAAHDAPDDGSFVPVTWSPSPVSGVLAQLGAAAKTATLSLVAGGHAYRLGTVGRTMGGPFHVYVAVGDDADLQVAATYDGLTQTVDVASGKRSAGVAAALYSLPNPIEPTAADCADGWTADQGFAVAMTCTAQTSVVPWAGGWAATSMTFATAAVTLGVAQVTSHGGHGATYEVQSVQDHSTIDGVDPAAPLTSAAGSADQLGGRLTAQVADSGSHTLQLTLVCIVQRDSADGGGPAQATVTLQKTVPIDAAS